uniref:Uncharacterized protein n=1 Tax=Glossina palpalis gambiensis TaxID=67801 RepID=A0A1B0B1N8_9MUSC
MKRKALTFRLKALASNSLFFAAIYSIYLSCDRDTFFSKRNEGTDNEENYTGICLGNKNSKVDLDFSSVSHNFPMTLQVVTASTRLFASVPNDSVSVFRCSNVVRGDGGGGGGGGGGWACAISNLNGWLRIHMSASIYLFVLMHIDLKYIVHTSIPPSNPKGNF